MLVQTVFPFLFVQLLSKLQIQKKIGSLTMFNGQVLESLCKSSSLGESELTKLVQAWVAEVRQHSLFLIHPLLTVVLSFTHD